MLKRSRKKSTSPREESTGEVNGHRAPPLWPALIAVALMLGGRCEIALAQASNSPSAARHRQQGIDHLNHHESQKALEEFRSAVLLDPKDAVSHDNIGVILAQSGETQQAVEEFQKAVQLSDSLALAHFHLGLAYDRTSRSSDAVKEYEAALRVETGLIDARYALSALCWKLGDHNGAIHLLRQVAEQKPPFAAEAHYNLGLELRQQGNLNEAVQEFKEAVALRPDSPKAYLALSQTLAEKQDTKSAIEFVRKAVELDSSGPEYHYNLGETLRLRGELDAAEAELRTALTRDPHYPLAHRQLGVVLRQKGDYEGAVTELQEAASEDAEDAEARYYLGSALLKLDRVEQAIESLTQAVRLDPYDSGAHVTLAGAFQRIGRTMDAEEQLKEAQAISALRAKAGRSRVLLGSAADHLRQGQVDTAISELRQAKELSPEYADAHLQLALALLRKGKAPAEVVPVLRRAIELKPDDAQARLRLGLVLEKTGQRTEGLREIKRSVELAPSLADGHRELGKAALASHDWPAAVSEYGAILAWDPKNREARLGLAAAQAHRSRPNAQQR